MRFGADKADDEAAVGLIETAMGALEKFYTDNNLALVQVPAASSWGSGSSILCRILRGRCSIGTAEKHRRRVSSRASRLSRP